VLCCAVRCLTVVCAVAVGGGEQFMNLPDVKETVAGIKPLFLVTIALPDYAPTNPLNVFSKAVTDGPGYVLFCVFRLTAAGAKALATATSGPAKLLRVWAVLCCAVLCCAPPAPCCDTYQVLCSPLLFVSCCAVCCVALRCAVLWWLVCCAVLCCVVPCLTCAVLFCAALRCGVVRCGVVLCVSGAAIFAEFGSRSDSRSAQSTAVFRECG
jgi:hypothetical protein